MAKGSDDKETELGMKVSGTDSGFGDSDRSTSWKKEDSDAVYRHFRYLKDEIYVQPLVDRFYEDGSLDTDDNEEILGQRIRRQSVDIFLRKLLRFGEVGYERLLDYLRQSGQSHVADTLQENRFPSELPDINKTHAEMEASILMNIDALCDDLEPDKTADYFIVYREFTIDEYESIISHRNRRMKAEEMVGLILEHLPRGYQVLRQIYKEMGKTKMLKALDEVFVAENLDEINKNIRETFERKRRELHCMHYGSGHFNTKMKLNVSGSASPACEEELVRRIQEQIEEINIGLQKYTSCRIVLVKEGSIVIHLLSCGTLFRMEDETRKDVSKLLNRIFLHPAVDAFGSYDGLRFRVTVESNIQMRLDGKLKKESIERHKDYLSEELSAVPFLRHKKARTIFKQSEIDSVFDCKPISREKRMQILLSIILRKGKPAVQFFETVLKEENLTNVLTQLCPGKCRRGDTILTGSYSALLDELSPSLIVEECKANGIENCIPLQLDSSQNRRKQCEVILQNALSQNQDIKQKFFCVLERNYPEHLGFMATSGKQAVSSRFYAVLDTEDVCWNVIYKGEHDIKRTELKQSKEVNNFKLDPDHLTTRKQDPEIFTYNLPDEVNASKETTKYGQQMVESRQPTNIIRFTDATRDQETNIPVIPVIELLSRSIKSNASSGYCSDNESSS